MGLGGLATFGLAEARERARLLRQQIKDGIDPLAAKRTAKAERELAAAKALTFAQAAQAFYAQHEGQWRNRKHAAQFLSTLSTFAFPVIGNLSVAAIDTGLVLKVLEQKVDAERGYPAGPLWQARPETASRLRGRIEFGARLGHRARLSPRSIIRRDGVGICRRPCPLVAPTARSSITPPCPTLSCRRSWRICASARASRRRRLSSRS